MAQYGFDDAKFSITSATNATVRIPMTQYIETINGIRIEGIVQETHTMGDSWREQAFVGVKQADDLTISGFYNDIASGPNFYWGNVANVGTSGRFIFDAGASELLFGAYVLKSYSKMPTRNELTKYEAVLGVTGAITTAS